MSSISITGKRWLNKKFDSSYVKYLKENHVLDEITARLFIDKKNR